MQAKYDNVTNNAKQLKATQQDLKAIREKVALKTKELEENKDKERETRGKASLDVKARSTVLKDDAFYLGTFASSHLGSATYTALDNF